MLLDSPSNIDVSLLKLGVMQLNWLGFLCRSCPFGVNVQIWNEYLYFS